jgi:subtilisin family serine protease
MSGSRGLLAAVAATGALAAAGPALGIDISLRSPSLPPPDGSSTAEALTLAEQGRELIVTVTGDKRAAAILRGERRLGQRIWLVSGKRSASVVHRLEAIDTLRYAHANGHMRSYSSYAAQGDPADPAPWWMPQIGANRVAAPAAGFPVTIVDDGIDRSHPEFALRPVTFLNQNAIVPGEDFHGTMVSSVAAAPVNGVGIAGLYPLVALRSADTGAGDCADVLAAVEAAITAGPTVVNMSWGFSPPICPALHDQIIRAVAAGILPVAATGNMRLHFSPPGVPAIWPHVLTVGSTGPEGEVSEFSNEGMGIDLAAPGESMVVAAPRFFDPSGYANVEGTSFSTSLVSAAAAWVATRRGAKMRQVADLLRSSARDVAPSGWDADTGYGILDIPSALRKPLPAVDPLEPNDDMNQVTAAGLLKREAPALTRPGRARATLRARLDRTEDPVDVYRVFVPARRQLRLRIAPTSNVDIEIFRPNARSCYYQSRSRALHGPLIGGRYGRGTAPETFPVRNRDNKGKYLFACVYKPRDVVSNASYTLSITTTRLTR